ncbi:MAG: hypothetical protein WB820_15380, partial [Rhodoplanes sp.]
NGLDRQARRGRKEWLLQSEGRRPRRQDLLTEVDQLRQFCVRPRPESVDALATRLAGRRFALVFINAGVSGPQHQSADIVTPQEVGALMYTNVNQLCADGLARG